MKERVGIPAESPPISMIIVFQRGEENLMETSKREIFQYRIFTRNTQVGAV